AAGAGAAAKSTAAAQWVPASAPTWDGNVSGAASFRHCRWQARTAGVPEQRTAAPTPPAAGAGKAPDALQPGRLPQDLLWPGRLVAPVALRAGAAARDRTDAGTRPAIPCQRA